MDLIYAVEIIFNYFIMHLLIGYINASVKRVSKYKSCLQTECKTLIYKAYANWISSTKIDSKIDTKIGSKINLEHGCQSLALEI